MIPLFQKLYFRKQTMSTDTGIERDQVMTLLETHLKNSSLPVSQLACMMNPISASSHGPSNL